MRKIAYLAVATVALGVASTQAGLLVAWDGSATGQNSSTSMTGFETSRLTQGGTTVNTTAGSNDGTYGPTLAGAATTAQGAYRGSNDAYITIILKNTSTAGVNMDSVVFDFQPWFSGSPNAVTLTYVGGNGTSGLVGVADDTMVNSISGLSDNLGKFSDYQDFDWTLSGLANQTLLAGDNAEFTLTMSGGTGIGSAFDNVGFVGTIPEPATFGLVGLFGGAITIIRRKFVG